MKFRVFSDVHLDFFRSDIIPQLWKPLKSDKDTTLIIAGDICTARKVDLTINWLHKLSSEFKYIIAVLGNHDYWGSPSWKDEVGILKNSADHNVHILEKEIIELDTIKIGGATLWTDINEQNPIDIINAKHYTRDFTFIPRMTINDWLTEFYLTKNWIWENKVDILVTHYVPSQRFCASRYKHNAANCMFNSEVIMNIPSERLPKYWLFGHTHDSYNEEILGTKFICNPKGYINENIHSFDEVSLYEI